MWIFSRWTKDNFPDSPKVALEKKDRWLLTQGFQNTKSYLTMDIIMVRDQQIRSLVIKSTWVRISTIEWSALTLEMWAMENNMASTTKEQTSTLKVAFLRITKSSRIKLSKTCSTVIIGVAWKTWKSSQPSISWVSLPTRKTWWTTPKTTQWDID